MANKNQNNKNQQVHEQIKPLFEDMGNTHVHDEKSYNDLKKSEIK